MSYTPPVGVVDLNLELAFTPPIGVVDLNLAPPGLNRTLAGVASTGGAHAAITAGNPNRVYVGAKTASPRAIAELAYDPNLLSAVHAVSAERWQEGFLADQGGRDHFSIANFFPGIGLDHWQAADLLSERCREVLQAADFINGLARENWQTADHLDEDKDNYWQNSPRYEGSTEDHWTDAGILRHSMADEFRDGLFIPASGNEAWQDGTHQQRAWLERFGDGPALRAVVIERWQEAGYPSNANNPSKDNIPVRIPFPWGTNLQLRCPLPGTTLRIGRSPCVLIAEHEIAIRRSYMSINSASLVRWPDLTPLPVTSMTMETDFDSWCWGFSATLAGTDAWALVQPNPLACEVLATVNGQQWKFLLDVPSTNRSFNQDQVTLKGRSRSAWLHAPYRSPTDFTETSAREMVQLAETALDNTGWTIDWQGENWVVPAGRYTSFNTPMGVLMRLANVTDDGIYTDPILQVLTLMKRWPVASWLLDGATADLLIPESAIISLSQSPLYTAPINGVYVSGISHGCLALVKITGTDGALQPPDPIVDELICDEEGVAARQRGLNALSDAGSGFIMDADTLFTPEIGLVIPGMIVDVAGMKGVSRSCRISATWSSGLQVIQSIGLERREVEA